MTNKFISMMDGFRQGIASSFGTRLLRFDSVSIVSRQSLLPILLLCLTLVVGVGQMWGATATITFTTTSNSNDSGTEYTTSTFVSNGISSKDDAFGTITCSSTSKCYAGKSGYGLKAGAQNSAGSFTISFSTPLTNVTKITLNRAAYNGNSTTITVKQGSTTLANSVSTGTSTSFSDMDITDLNIASLSSLTVSTGKYCYIKSITITTGSSSVAVSSVSVSPTSKSIVVGETFTVTPTVLPDNATNKNITWSSSATSKATVTNAGLVTGVAAGTSNIKATSEADATKNATCAVTVYSVTVQKKDEAGNTISVSGVTATATGRSLSASATAASKYVFKGWKYGTASGTSIASSGSASTTLNGTPTGNVTIIAEFYAPLTATWMVAGSEWTGKNEQTTFARGSHVSALPTAPNPNNSEGCGDKFVGWTTVEEYAHGSSPLYTSASQIPNATTNQIFYAVFADYDE